MLGLLHCSATWCLLSTVTVVVVEVVQSETQQPYGGAGVVTQKDNLHLQVEGWSGGRQVFIKGKSAGSLSDFITLT